MEIIRVSSYGRPAASQFRRDKMKHLQRGQTVVEYSLLVSLVAIASIGVITQYGDEVRAIFQNIIMALSGL